MGLLCYLIFFSNYNYIKKSRLYYYYVVGEVTTRKSSRKNPVNLGKNGIKLFTIRVLGGFTRLKVALLPIVPHTYWYRRQSHY